MIIFLEMYLRVFVVKDSCVRSIYVVLLILDVEIIFFEKFIGYYN